MGWKLLLYNFYWSQLPSWTSFLPHIRVLEESCSGLPASVCASRLQAVHPQLCFPPWSPSSSIYPGHPSLCHDLPHQHCSERVARRYISKGGRIDPMSFQQCCFLPISRFHTKLVQVLSPPHVSAVGILVTLLPLSWSGWSQYPHTREWAGTPCTQADTGPTEVEGRGQVSRSHFWTTTVYWSDVLVLLHASELLEV